MKFTFDIGDFDRFNKICLARIFAHFGDDVGEIDRFENVFFGSANDFFIPFKNSILVYFQSHLLGNLASGDIMSF